ncbi:tRNA (guanosine(46)-N7)-methyltransferase TrmB [Staphylococcus sp. Marseille-Q6910]|uniref:tRNA (guanosine(46)-N7)-methyltransferase TrmB n=1 Tax=Staphylococcus sp. Marseille-Q6910 TaxID=2937990 RepID=UPI00203C5BFB|nr:tRNA (guanosine(46)-N7)-methyltransferase TrmB [Staphylococcus sp. Marseille-Q6910]
MRVRYKPWAEDYLKSHPEIVDMDGAHAGKISDWFEKEQPIYIEIGSGKGQFITTLAEQHPEINFISMEREKSVMVNVLQKVFDLGLTNIKLICNDAIELNEYFKDEEVSRIYLNFSDPWPKKRHAKRRLTYHTYLARYKQILKKDGEIHFKTDNRGLFAYSLESMSQFGMYFTKMNLNLHEEDIEENIVTEYEKKFSKKGSRIYRMEAKFHE